MSDLTSGRPPVEPAPASRAPGGRSAPHAYYANEREIRTLAELLVQVVGLTHSTVVVPGRWETIAEQAMEQPSVRAAQGSGS